MKLANPIVRRAIEALALGLTIGGALKVWEHRDRLDELDEQIATLDEQIERIERIPVIQDALVDAIVKRRAPEAEDAPPAFSRIREELSRQRGRTEKYPATSADETPA